MVYVDAPIWKLGRMKMCHMIADSEDELHRMARRLGLKRAWFQHDARHPHYDICKQKRALAIKHGAVALDRREFVTKMRSIRGEHV